MRTNLHKRVGEADQIGEITKLVEDAQERLDQVVPALRTLESRIKVGDRDGGDPD